ncbi:MAG: hypothetical protein K2P94_08470 [Rhodospirillaceae bacterium]|nr:hypothetical protein [Rhodospirillaceae bacterium]
MTDLPVRRERARAALDAYIHAHPDADRRDLAQETDACVIGGLLADLRHLCAQNGIDFDDRVRTSETHFEAEK